MGNVDVNIVSWNINGCGTPVKRKKVLSYLKSHNADIAYIQETHFANENEALKLKRDWVGKVFHNSRSSKSRGVMILINKRLNFVLLKESRDEDGRVLALQALINGVQVVLCNIYAPNRDEPNFMDEVNKMLGNMKGQILLGGDFNNVMDEYIDRSAINATSSTRTGTAIDALKEDLSVVDIWRLVHPMEREYTFYSHSHKTYSRIDYFLISKSCVNLVVNCDIGVIALTDHAPVELHINLNVEKNRTGRWRLNSRTKNLYQP